MLSDAFRREYETFIAMLFRTESGRGKDAKIRATIQSPDGDRTKDCNYTWDSRWAEKFTDPATDRHPAKQEVLAKYDALMSALKDSVGLAAART